MTVQLRPNFAKTPRSRPNAKYTCFSVAISHYINGSHERFTSLARRKVSSGPSEEEIRRIGLNELS